MKHSDSILREWAHQMVHRIPWNAEATGRFPIHPLDLDSSNFHIHGSPKNILSSSFPFTNFHSFHITYWSTKRKRLSSLRVDSYQTWVPVSTSSACTPFEAWPDFVLLRVAHKEGQQCKLLTHPLPCRHPPHPHALSRGYLHVFPDVWYELKKSR